MNQLNLIRHLNRSGQGRVSSQAGERSVTARAPAGTQQKAADWDATW